MTSALRREELLPVDAGVQGIDGSGHSSEIRQKIKAAFDRRVAPVPAEFKALKQFAPGLTWGRARAIWCRAVSNDVALSRYAYPLAEIIRDRLIVRRGVRGGILGAARLFDQEAAKRLNCSPRTVQRARASLINRGWIHVTGAWKSGQSLTYFINLSKITVWSRPEKENARNSGKTSTRITKKNPCVASDMVAKIGDRRVTDLATITHVEDTHVEEGLSTGDFVRLSRFPLRQLREMRLEVMAYPEDAAAFDRMLQHGARIFEQRNDLRSAAVNECHGAAVYAGRIQPAAGLSIEEKTAALVQLMGGNRP